MLGAVFACAAAAAGREGPGLGREGRGADVSCGEEGEAGAEEVGVCCVVVGGCLVVGE